MNNDNVEESSHVETGSGHYGVLKFLTTAVCVFAGFSAIYEYYLLDSDIFIDYLEMSAASAAWFLNTIGQSVERVASGWGYETKLIWTENKGRLIVVTAGCDASVVFATLLSTVLAWPSPWGKRILATVVGLFVMYCLNILRISGMLLVDMYLPDHFDLFHEWILPTLLVLGPMAYFYAWTLVSNTHPTH